MPTFKRDPQKQFPPVGKCIYCGATEDPLTDEHIVPFGLGGHVLLPKSSCLACARITHAYEYTVLRSTLGVLRMRLGFPTRRPKERPKFIEIGTVASDGRRSTRKISWEEYPVGSFLPHYGRASIFLGGMPELNTLRDDAAGFYAYGDLAAFIEKYNWDGRINFKHHPVEFGQMVIKICYGMAICELGTDAFDPICLDQILSKDLNISYIFGQNGLNEKTDGYTKIWDLKFVYRVFEDRALLYANFSLIPGAGSPIYEVAIGTIETPERLARVHKHMAEGNLQVLSG